tara:strand:- start:768 stop:1001 length:234 start_codon:yes stop_codon:yes gene_type:complete
MFLRLKILTLNISIAILLIFFLCLGSQKENRVGYNLNFLGYQSFKTPVGFLLGASFTFGLMSGGLTSVLMIKDNDKL